ncbi:membrane protein [Lysobacter daejeonensis GH1-9]|uniref:Membrane protein n=1 Tax=Lysobacter daejeonensis GH1-9 TaxID=1385517 RepID=A0A0A0EVS5_9GAMM|nr:membrane protein [Lysobacter daejeonensis]KGM54223.1 membrane protein [Lysobacter daejeonensis GH1-9]
MGRTRTLLFIALSLAYPLVVYTMLGRFEPRWLAVLLCALALLRAITTRERLWLWAALGTGLLAAWATLSNAALPLKLYPALVNGVLLLVFGLSLRFGPPVAERLARLHEPDLPPAAVAYTRRVTQVWCGFFVFNGTVALVTALWASERVWVLYNGLIAYGLIGALFAVEWLVRQRVKARAHG